MTTITHIQQDVALDFLPFSVTRCVTLQFRN